MTEKKDYEIIKPYKILEYTPIFGPMGRPIESEADRLRQFQQAKKAQKDIIQDRK